MRVRVTFRSPEFCLPPPEVIHAELAREQRGQFNVIHADTGFKADFYLAGRDAFHAWAFRHARRMAKINRTGPHARRNAKLERSKFERLLPRPAVVPKKEKGRRNRSGLFTHARPRTVGADNGDTLPGLRPAASRQFWGQRVES